MLRLFFPRFAARCLALLPAIATAGLMSCTPKTADNASRRIELGQWEICCSMAIQDNKPRVSFSWHAQPERHHHPLHSVKIIVGDLLSINEGDTAYIVRVSVALSRALLVDDSVALPKVKWISPVLLEESSFHLLQGAALLESWACDFTLRDGYLIGTSDTEFVLGVGDMNLIIKSDVLAAARLIALQLDG